MTTCNAPCIVNTGSGFHLVFCGEELGHYGDHLRYISNPPTNPIVRWTYTAEVADLSDRPPARALMPSSRCKAATFVPGLRQLESVPDGLRRLSRMPPLFALVRHADHNDGFSCEQKQEHSGFHMRSGTFGPLGIAWSITWS